MRITYESLFRGDAPALRLLADGGEAPVQALLLDQLVVGAVLGDAAVVHHQDLIGLKQHLQRAVAFFDFMNGSFDAFGVSRRKEIDVPIGSVFFSSCSTSDLDKRG